MNSNRKNIPIVLLLVLFVFNTCGLSFVLFFGIQFHRTAQEKKINDLRSAEVLHIRASLVEQPNSDFEWKNDHEFRYQGEMYDVIKADHTGTEYVFFCKKDRKEDKMISVLKNNSEDNSPLTGKRTEKNQKTSDYLSPLPSFVFPNLRSEVSILISTVKHPVDPFLNFPAPPPWQV